MTTININIKSSSEDKFVITIESSKTVLDLKTAIAERTNVSADRQRLIYSGRVLKDGDILSDCKIADGNTVHMVKGSAPGAARATTSQATPAPASTGSPANNTTTNTSTPSQQANPFAALGGMGGFGDAAQGGGMANNPFAMLGGMMNGMGGMGGNGFGQMGPDPAWMTQLLQNPMFAQYMSSVLQNPAVLDSIISSSPHLSAMGPEIRNMMQSPEFRSMLSNPEMIRQTASMASALQNMGVTQPPVSSTPATDSTQPPVNPFAAFANPAVDPQLQQRLASLLGMPANTPPADNRPPEERFQVQLQQLNEMGFWDAARNIRALLATGGNVNAAIEMLLNGTI